MIETLNVIFILLLLIKLSGVIPELPWWVVLMPVWILFVAALCMMSLVGIPVIVIILLGLLAK